MSINLDNADLRRIELRIKALGGVPQRCVTQSVKKGAAVIRKSAKGKVPVKTGALKRGIVLKGEKLRKKGKKVYQITFDAKMNDVFRKPINNPGLYGGKRKTGYYPVSMEYGFLSKGGKIEGIHFMLDAAVESEAAAKSKILTSLNQEIDKEWAKR